MHTFGVVLTTFGVMFFVFVQIMLDIFSLCDRPSMTLRLMNPFSWIAYVSVAAGIFMIYRV